MSRTLNELIANVILPDEVDIARPFGSDTDSVETEQEDRGEVEKLASALEFLVRRGVHKVISLEKVAMATCPKCGSKCGSCKGKSCKCCKHAKAGVVGSESAAEEAMEDAMEDSMESEKDKKAYLSSMADTKAGYLHSGVSVATGNSHVESAHDLQAVRAELAARVAKRNTNA